MIPAVPPPPSPPFYTHSFHLRTHYTTHRHTSGEDAHKDAIRVEVAAQKVPPTQRRLKLQSLKCVYACQVRLQNVAFFCCRGRRAGTKIPKKITITSNGICREPRSRSGRREAPAVRFWRLPPTVSNNNGPLAAWPRRPSRVSQRV